MTKPETFESPEEDDRLAEERREALFSVVEQYLDDDDKEFLLGVDDEADRTGYVYGRLLALGHDDAEADEVLRNAGVLKVEEGDDEV